MDIEESIVSYVILKNEAPLDQTRFSLEESRLSLTTLLEDNRICQLCKQICAHGFTPVKDLESDITRDLYIPELNFNFSSEPVVCSSCFDALNTHKRSIHSLDVGSEISNASEEKESFLYIKTENIDIKFEEDDVSNTPDRDNAPCDGQTNQNRRATDTTIPPLRNPTYKDNSARQSYECDLCGYKTPYAGSFEFHLLRHKGASQVQTFKCDRCDFKANHKKYLAEHQLDHEAAREAKMYKCGQCSFQTTEKLCIEPHRLTHKEVQMYKCYQCSFITQHMRSLEKHQLEHEAASQVQAYRCDKCSFETPQKSGMISHQLTHKKVGMHICDLCGFETKYRSSLWKHKKVRHGDGSKACQYKCDKYYMYRIRN